MYGPVYTERERERGFSFLNRLVIFVRASDRLDFPESECLFQKVARLFFLSTNLASFPQKRNV